MKIHAFSILDRSLAEAEEIISSLDGAKVSEMIVIMSLEPSSDPDDYPNLEQFEMVDESDTKWCGRWTTGYTCASRVPLREVAEYVLKNSEVLEVEITLTGGELDEDVCLSWEIPA